MNHPVNSAIHHRRVVGIDIGGTKIAAGVVAPDGSILDRRRRDTPRTGSGADVMHAVVALLQDIVSQHTVEAIGLGVKGVVDTQRGVVLQDGDTLPGWGGTEVAAPVSAAFDLPVFVENDVRVTALAEAVLGAGAGHDRLLVASAGTGVGGGLVAGRRVLHGPHGTTGEIAHLLVPGPGAIPCGCGRFDHLESISAGPAIAAEYVRRTGGSETLTLHQVADALAAGDLVAARTIKDAAEVFGRALAGLATALDVDAVVIGGGVAQLHEAFFVPAAAALRESVLQPLRELPVLPAALGTDAPVVGAAALTGLLG